MRLSSQEVEHTDDGLEPEVWREEEQLEIPPGDMVEEEEIDQDELDAIEMGWVPKNEFKGRPEDWRDAKTFVARGREINPILRKHNEELKRKVDKMQAEHAEFARFAAEARQRDKDALEAQIADTRARKHDAIEIGDVEMAKALDEEELSLRAKARAPEKEAPPPAPELPPIAVEWMENNTWYGKNARATRYADQMADELKEENPNMSHKQLLQAIDEEMKARFPEVYPERQRAAAPRNVSSAVRAPVARAKPGRTYDNLPDDAKQQCDAWVKKGWIKDRAAYAADYDWS